MPSSNLVSEVVGVVIAKFERLHAVFFGKSDRTRFQQILLVVKGEIFFCLAIEEKRKVAEKSFVDKGRSVKRPLHRLL